MGLAKKECSAYMRRDNLAPPGGRWAVRCKCLPINSAEHFLRVVQYIRDHEAQGAVVWESESGGDRSIARKSPVPLDEWGDFDPDDLLLE